MEDLKRRFEFKNINVQIQAVSKLYEDVKKKKPRDQLISASTPEYAELKMLWQYTGSEISLVARASSNRLVHLLKEQYADFTYILNSFLNQVPAAKSLYGIIEGIAQLLELQVILKEAAGETYTCPYLIRNPPHPFISVLTNRPAESWSLILEQVDKIFTSQEPSIRKNALVMLNPFIKYVCLDPKCSEEYNKLRSALRTLLVDTAARTDHVQTKQNVFRYMVDMLPSMQIKSTETVAETSQFCTRLLYLYGDHASDLELAVGQQVVTFGLELCQVNLEKCLGSYSLLQALLHISTENQQVLVRNENLACLGQLLLSNYPEDNLPCLQLVKEILKSGHGTLSPLCAGFVAMAAISIVSNPASVTMVTKQKLMTSLASEVVTLVEGYTLLTDKVEEQPLPRSAVTSTSYEMQLCVRLAHHFIQDISVLNRWLVKLEKHILRLQTVPQCITNLLAALLLKIPNTETSLLVIHRLTDVTKIQPAQGLYLLPVFLYAIGKRFCPTVRLHLLEALPKLAIHKYNVPAVLKTLQNLMLSPDRKSVV